MGNHSILYISSICFISDITYSKFYFKLLTLRKIITIISFPVLPLFFFYPINTLYTKIFQLIFPDYLSAEVGDVYIRSFYIVPAFSVITLSFVFYLFRLYRNKETDKFKKTLIIYGVLFFLFIVLVIVNAYMSKMLYAKHHAVYLP